MAKLRQVLAFALGGLLLIGLVGCGGGEAEAEYKGPTEKFDESKGKPAGSGGGGKGALPTVNLED